MQINPLDTDHSAFATVTAMPRQGCIVTVFLLLLSQAPYGSALNHGFVQGLHSGREGRGEGGCERRGHSSCC